jgi:hypothetical protein
MQHGFRHSAPAFVGGRICASPAGDLRSATVLDDIPALADRLPVAKIFQRKD